MGANKNTDTLGNLATALEPLVTDVAAGLLVTNPEPGAYTVEELIQEPRLVRLALPVASNPRIYPIIGRLVLAQFTYAVLAPDCNRQIFKLIAVDEARFFITDSVATGMAQARSSNAGFALSFQTLNQIRDEVLLDNIFANAGSKLVMGKVSDKDAERYSRIFGTIELPYVTHSTSASQGTNKNNGHSYSRGGEFEILSSGHESRSSRSDSSGRSSSAGSSEGTNLITSSRRRFLDSEIREAPQRHALVESSDDHGQQWFGQVVNMDTDAVRELEQEVRQYINFLLKKRKRIRNIPETTNRNEAKDSSYTSTTGNSFARQTEKDEQQYGSTAKSDLASLSRNEQSEGDPKVAPGPRPRIRVWSVTPLEASPTPTPTPPAAPTGPTSVAQLPTSRAGVEKRPASPPAPAPTPNPAPAPAAIFNDIDALNQSISGYPKLIPRKEAPPTARASVTNEPAFTIPMVVPTSENNEERAGQGSEPAVSLDPSQPLQDTKTPTAANSNPKSGLDRTGGRKTRKTVKKAKVVEEKRLQTEELERQDGSIAGEGGDGLSSSGSSKSAANTRQNSFEKAGARTFLAPTGEAEDSQEVKTGEKTLEEVNGKEGEK